MPLTIGSNIASVRSQRQLANVSQDLTNVYERLSTGQRINSASDDAAGLAIADSLKVQSRIFTQGVRNVNDGISYFNIADSAIESLSAVVDRLKELTIQAANGSYGNNQRKALDAEAQALSKEFTRISNTTKFNGIRILTGQNGLLNLQAGIGSDAVLSGDTGGAIGTGSFGSTTTSSMSAATTAFKAADFNSDGLLDVLSVTSTSLIVKLGLGDGTFGATISTVNAGAAMQGLDAADYNNDGILDVATYSGAAGILDVFLGNGDGSFGSVITVQSATANSNNIISADLNGDGKLDLLNSTSSSRINVLLGNGDGTFAPAISISPLGYQSVALAAADLNGDGIVDIVTNATVSALTVYFGRGDGTFAGVSSSITPPQYATSTAPTRVKIADLNNDGILDLASTDYGNTLSVLLGNGNGTFGASRSYAVGTSTAGAITIGDFNGDGNVDISTAHSAKATGGTTVLLGAGNGTFNTQSFYSTTSRSTALDIGDFNNDGVLDLVTAAYSSSGVALNLGSTTSGVGPILPFSLKTIADARQALPILQRKGDQLSSQRGTIGAFQSRLNSARAVLEAQSENYKAAESRIRDVDVAEESSQLIRKQILQKAAGSVLAQANLQPSLALNLLSNLN